MFKYIIAATFLLGAAYAMSCKTCGQIYFSKTNNEHLKNISEAMEGMALCSAPKDEKCKYSNDTCQDYSFTIAYNQTFNGTVVAADIEMRFAGCENQNTTCASATAYINEELKKDPELKNATVNVKKCNVNSGASRMATFSVFAIVFAVMAKLL